MIIQLAKMKKRIGCKMTWLYTMNMWMYTFILKFIPAVILTVITGLLIHAIYKADRKSARLKSNASKVKTLIVKIEGCSMLRKQMQFLRRLKLFLISFSQMQ